MSWETLCLIFVGAALLPALTWIGLMLTGMVFMIVAVAIGTAIDFYQAVVRRFAKGRK